ncbi:hypothetical protein HZC07_01675, partial [Candidatus Micrarchaeota archaeon]|nr:hypothetical protein [Candidatus Micrarchaeota archaeon]
MKRVFIFSISIILILLFGCLSNYDTNSSTTSNSTNLTKSITTTNISTLEINRSFGIINQTNLSTNNSLSTNLSVNISKNSSNASTPVNNSILNFSNFSKTYVVYDLDAGLNYTETEIINDSGIYLNFSPSIPLCTRSDVNC